MMNRYDTTGHSGKRTGRKIFDIVVYAFALAGFGIIGAWGFYQLGFTKNKGAVDENYRYLMSVGEMKGMQDSTLTQQQINEQWSNQYARLVAFGKFYPENARIIMNAAQHSKNPGVVDRMVAAAMVYAEGDKECANYMNQLDEFLKKQPQKNNPNCIPWMATVEWETLRQAIMKDTADIIRAGEITGVEPRLIAACLVGEQIRLFNSKREMFKKYLGPVKVLSVQSTFSYGVNGVKEATAIAVEEHLKDPKSEFYMGKHYENILDFATNDHSNERYKRLVDYRSHLYSYIYTGCILHQTMLQWKRAGYDISNRPDILCTLFNVGFSQSHPKAEPRCGGSHINIDDKVYTFGTVGFDFYFSGDLAEALGYWEESFVADDGKPISEAELRKIQSSLSDCGRPEKGHEYKEQKTESAE